MRRRFDLNLLAIAVALDDERSVSAAARKLGMSQPAVSAALGRLRATFADPLFIRIGNQMAPTPRADEIVVHARDVLARVDDRVLYGRAFEPNSGELEITIALSDVGEMVFLPRILLRVKALSPRALVRSVSPPPAELERRLESGDVDLAIGYFPDLSKSNFVQQRLFDHHFLCILRAEHPIRGDRLTLEQFLELEHAVVRAPGRSQEIFERYLEKRRIKRKVALLTPHFMSLPMIVARSDLTATVPHAVALYWTRAATNIRAMRPPFEVPKIVIRQHWHRKFQNDARNKWLRSMMRELFSSQSDEWRTPATGR